MEIKTVMLQKSVEFLLTKFFEVSKFLFIGIGKLIILILQKESKDVVIERYILIDKFDFHKKKENAPIFRLKLDKRYKCKLSELYLKKYLCLNKTQDDISVGWMDFYINKNEVKLHGYALIYTCSNVFIAPGDILLKNKNEWVEEVKSNQFKLEILSKRYPMVGDIKWKILDQLPSIFRNLFLKYIDIYERLLYVEQKFKVPRNYTGPFIKERIFIYKKGIGIILSISYLNNNEKVIYILKKYNIKSDIEETRDEYFPFSSKKGSYWEYIVYNCSDITSKLNIKYSG